MFQIGTETETARNLSEKSLSVLQDLKRRLEALRKRYFKNNLDITNAEDTINKAEIAAEAAERVSVDLRGYISRAANHYALGVIFHTQVDCIMLLHPR